MKRIWTAISVAICTPFVYWGLYGFRGLVMIYCPCLRKPIIAMSDLYNGWRVRRWKACRKRSSLL